MNPTLPDPINTFCTGRFSAVPDVTRDPYLSPLDPDGELGYRILCDLREGEAIKDTARKRDVTADQVAALRPHLETVPAFRVKREQPADLDTSGVMEAER